MSNPKRSTWVLLAIVVGGAACGDPTSPSDVAGPLLPSLGAEIACYGVTGTIVETFQGADLPNNLFFFGGPVSGDLIGTSSLAVTGPGDAPGDPPGPINGGFGTRTIEVTGGTIDALVGGTLVFDGEEVLRQDPPRSTGHGRYTLVSGGRGGHLTVQVDFDFVTSVLTSEYRGSVCP